MNSRKIAYKTQKKQNKERKYQNQQGVATKKKSEKFRKNLIFNLCF